MGFLHDGRERTNGLLAPSTHEPLVDGSAHAPRPAAGATSAARTVAVPRHAEGDASLTPASALLAWLLLVARYNDESHDLASFVWGRTSESGTDMVLSAPRDFVASLRAGSSAEWTLRQAENLLRSALERDTEAAGTTTLRQGDAFFFASSKSSGLLQKPVLHESESSPKVGPDGSHHE
ncbi:hypothetical protein VTK73DRAFT_1788 [Phialemonium thermophilum]|uniref:Uncharacterized protein n=1 Tax=Phialemonium thermophilum TaxID=223376 RepID=A0ABR3VSY6_9PEZI